MRINLNADLILTASNDVARLTRKQLQAARRYYGRGRTQVEIARKLGVTQSAISQRLAAARRNCQALTATAAFIRHPARLHGVVAM